MKTINPEIGIMIAKNLQKKTILIVKITIPMEDITIYELQQLTKEINLTRPKFVGLVIRDASKYCKCKFLHLHKTSQICCDCMIELIALARKDNIKYDIIQQSCTRILNVKLAQTLAKHEECHRSSLESAPLPFINDNQKDTLAKIDAQDDLAQENSSPQEE